MKLFPDRIVQANKSRQYLVSFGGINKNENFRTGELADSLNLSHDRAPFLYPRGSREGVGEFEAPSSLFMHDGIAVVDGTSFFYKGPEDKNFSEKFQMTEGKKQIAQLGNYTVVFPDKIWYNSETDEYGDMEGKIALKNYKVNGTSYNDWTISHNTLTISDRKDVHTFGEQFRREYSAGDVILKVYGYADWKGETYTINKENAVIKSISSTTNGETGLTITTAYFEDNTFLDSSEITRTLEGWSDLTLRKEIPSLEYICSAGGRIWGTEGNRIFASAYLNPTSFTKYDGLSGDSYYIDVTSPGEFTGCTAYSSHVVFFKEETIHRIYGSRPSNFQLMTSGAPGVQKGSWDSIRTINECVYYKGEKGIYAYLGGMPQLVCDALGSERYTDAVAGVKDSKYYISMKDSSGAAQLFVLDTERGTLLREDETEFLAAAQKDGDLYFFDSTNSLNKISDVQERSETEWSAELREFNETINEKKGFLRLSLRYELTSGAWFKIEVAADGAPFETVATINKTGCRTVAIPLPKNRCDRFRIRISGKGECKIMNLVRDFFTGSGVR